jgi:hypothetical protein
MARKKFTQLPVAGTLAGDEIVAIVQDGVSKQSTAQDIADLGSGGVEHWRGSYDASVDAYPSSGGSGGGGSIQAGDEWYISVSGDLDINGLGVTTVYPGALLKALVNTPGTTPANWKVIQ